MLEAVKAIYITQKRPKVNFCPRQSMPRELEGVRVATKEVQVSRGVHRGAEGVPIDNGF